LEGPVVGDPDAPHASLSELANEAEG
jgi:hypothetical protein